MGMGLSLLRQPRPGTIEWEPTRGPEGSELETNTKLRRGVEGAAGAALCGWVRSHPKSIWPCPALPRWLGDIRERAASLGINKT